MIGYDPHFTKSTGGEVWQALIIPTSPHTYSARNLSSKGEGDRFRKYGPNHLLNVEAINQHNKAVIIVEGEIDALSVIEAGGEAVGLGSASNVNSFLASAKEADPEAVFIVALDNDEAGEKKGKELLEGLKALNLTAVNVNITPQHKDANEALQADRGELIYQIERAEAIAIEERENQKAALKEEQERERDAYLETSAYHGLNDFIKRIRATQKARCNPTGFHELDQLLDGGLYAGLYFIGAISSLGKTTFAIQVADNIAAKGNDVIIFSLEMDRDELLAKSISRLTFQIDHERTGAHRSAKTTRGILTGAMRNSYNDGETALVNQAIAEYSKIASRLYFHIGVGDIGSGKVREVIDRHIAITGNRPVILIDYLQILSAPNNDKYLSDKMKTDDNVLELKRISRDHGIPIIGISSFNRDNYNEPVNLASFKESGAIEYSSDVLIGLQYAGMDYQDGETETNRRKRVRELYNKAQQDAKDGLPIQIELKILKNRNGTKGRVGLSYIPMFNYFEDSYTADPLISQSAQENSPLAFDDWQEVIPAKKEPVQIEINASLDQGNAQ